VKAHFFVDLSQQRLYIVVIVVYVVTLQSCICVFAEYWLKVGVVAVCLCNRCVYHPSLWCKCVRESSLELPPYCSYYRCVTNYCIVLQQNEDFLIQIKLDKAEDLSTADIDGEWRLMELLSSYRALIVKVLLYFLYMIWFLSISPNSISPNFSSPNRCRQRGQPSYHAMLHRVWLLS